MQDFVINSELCFESFTNHSCGESSQMNGVSYVTLLYTQLPMRGKKNCENYGNNKQNKHGHKIVHSDFCVYWVYLTVVCSRHGCTVKMIITEVSV